MKKLVSAIEHVLPRPIDKLPEYAHATARRTLAEKLVLAFGMSEAAAEALANAVVDPASVRKTISDPEDPNVEEIAVPGGMLWGIRTSVWTRRVMPDPRNPRIGPSRRHPFAVDPGTGNEDSRFRPVPEPRSPEEKPETTPELVVEIDSRHHLEWASAQAGHFVLAANDWRQSIRSQGVMEPIWLAATTYMHSNGSASMTVPVSVEGSSRLTAAHDILEVRSSDVPYDVTDQKLRTLYRSLNEAHDRGTTTAEQVEQLRCERIPALLLVGFRPNTPGVGFPTAVRSLVALRHVDPPTPWGEGPANEALADEVLDELLRRKLITATEHTYYAGSCTKAQARDAHLPDCPARRSARIVSLFANAEGATSEAIRVAVTSQSTRRRISKKLFNELATALIMRSVADDAKIDQTRRYLRAAFGQAVYNQTWESTGRETDALAKEALKEVECANADENITEPGPASLELAVRAAYPLIVTSGLHSDRGTRDNNQPDRRLAGEVLDRMRRTVQGVHQLAQSLRDFANGQHIRAVDEQGNVKRRADGTGDLIVNDAYLRLEFPPPGKIRGQSGGSTPIEQLKERLSDLGEALDRVGDAFNAAANVAGIDGNPLVEVEGVDPLFCNDRRQLLSKIGDELNFWGRTWRRRHGGPATPVVTDDSDEYDDDADATEEEIEAAYDASLETWDAKKGAGDETGV